MGNVHQQPVTLASVQREWKQWTRFYRDTWLPSAAASSDKRRWQRQWLDLDKASNAAWERAARLVARWPPGTPMHDNGDYQAWLAILLRQLTSFRKHSATVSHVELYVANLSDAFGELGRDVDLAQSALEQGDKWARKIQDSVPSSSSSPAAAALKRSQAALSTLVKRLKDDVKMSPDDFAILLDDIDRQIETVERDWQAWSGQRVREARHLFHRKKELESKLDQRSGSHMERKRDPDVNELAQLAARQLLERYDPSDEKRATLEQLPDDVLINTLAPLLDVRSKALTSGASSAFLEAFRKPMSLDRLVLDASYRRALAVDDDAKQEARVEGIMTSAGRNTVRQLVLDSIFVRLRRQTNLPLLRPSSLTALVNGFSRLVDLSLWLESDRRSSSNATLDVAWSDALASVSSDAWGRLATLRICSEVGTIASFEPSSSEGTIETVMNASTKLVALRHLTLAPVRGRYLCQVLGRLVTPLESLELAVYENNLPLPGQRATAVELADELARAGSNLRSLHLEAMAGMQVDEIGWLQTLPTLTDVQLRNVGLQWASLAALSHLTTLQLDGIVGALSQEMVDELVGLPLQRLALRFLEDDRDAHEEKESINRRFLVALTERKTDTLSKTLRVFSLSPFSKDDNWAIDHQCVRLPQWIAFVRRFANVKDLRGKMVIEQRDDKLDLESSFPSGLWSDLELHNEQAAFDDPLWYYYADRRVLSFLKRQGQLKRLKLAMVNTVEAEELCNTLPGTLTELNVFRCYMLPWSCRAVDSLVAHCPRLRILDMQTRSDHACWTQPFVQIDRLIEKLPHLTRLITTVGRVVDAEESANEAMAHRIHDLAYEDQRLFERVVISLENDTTNTRQLSNLVFVGVHSVRDQWMEQWL